MHYLNYHEQIQHRTGDFPLAYYPVDEDYPRYRMPMHWHKESEIIRIISGRMRFFLDDDEVVVESVHFSDSLLTLSYLISQQEAHSKEDPS